MKRSAVSLSGEGLVNTVPEERSSASAAILLASGGDKRIWPDPVTGRNRYGTLTRPAEEEISFSSSTASNPSPDAFAAANKALSSLIGASPTSSTEQWFAEIHRSLLDVLGCAHAQTILAASGTDAELLSLGVVCALSGRPVTNVFVAPDETGNGVPQAAAGRHFSDTTALGFAVNSGTQIAGLDSERIEARAIAIRDPLGRPRDAADVDADMIACVEHELRGGRDVIVHVLDSSKTGLTGVTRGAARHVAGLAPGRVWVVIDACQWRCPIGHLREDLDDGFIVLVTASKFFAAPPFAGAVLLPGTIAAALSKTKFPIGLLDYTAAQDWSPGLRDGADINFNAEMNVGLGLRWIAGLHNIRKYIAISGDIEWEIRKAFVRFIRARVGPRHGYYIHEHDDGLHLVSRGIVPLAIVAREGSLMQRAVDVQVGMRSAEGIICHAGQPVTVGNRAVLRVSLSAAHIIDIATRMSSGQSLSCALATLERDLETFFSKWDSLRRDGDC